MKKEQDQITPNIGFQNFKDWTLKKEQNTYKKYKTKLQLEIAQH